jgi:O-antigen/teichoic acid export membrane protein
MKPVNQSKALFRGAFILALAALFTKILSAVYRIPFQNIVGDVGFYIYQQIYPFYGLAIVLATTGFPVVISKLYAELKQKGDSEKIKFLLLASFGILQLFGIICFLILFFGSEQIASLMNDSQLAILLRVVSIVFLLFPLVSILRGFFQGNGDMVPTAISQVGEQLTRTFTILFLAYVLSKGGYSLYLIGGGAMFGSITGSIVSVLILFMFLRVRKQWKVVAPRKGLLQEYAKEFKAIFIALTFQGLTICISGMLMIFIQLADSLNLYALLVNSGIDTQTAKELKGIFDRGQPLIQLGIVVATAMSLSLVPLITSVRMKKDIKFLHDKVQLALRVGFVIGIGASVGLWAIIEPTNIMLFENDLGSPVLGVLSFVILFTSLIMTINAILQGMGLLIFPSIAVAIAFPIKYILNTILVPGLGTIGAAYATLITLFIVCVLLYRKFKRVLAIPLIPVPLIKTVILAGVMMAVVLKGYLFIIALIEVPLGYERIAAAAQALSGVFLGGCIYFLIVIRGGVFHEKELALFPFGSKLSLFLPKIKRS